MHNVKIPQHKLLIPSTFIYPIYNWISKVIAMDTKLWLYIHFIELASSIISILGKMSLHKDRWYCCEQRIFTHNESLEKQGVIQT